MPGVSRGHSGWQVCCDSLSSLSLFLLSLCLVFLFSFCPFYLVSLLSVFLSLSLFPSISLYFLSLSVCPFSFYLVSLSPFCVSPSLFISVSLSLSLQLGMSHHRGWGTGVGQGPKKHQFPQSSPRAPHAVSLSRGSRSCTCRGKVARLGPQPPPPAPSVRLVPGPLAPSSPGQQAAWLAFFPSRSPLARSRARSALLLGRFSQLRGWAAGSARPGSLPGRRRGARGVALVGVVRAWFGIFSQ